MPEEIVAMQLQQQLTKTEYAIKSASRLLKEEPKDIKVLQGLRVSLGELITKVNSIVLKIKVEEENAKCQEKQKL